MNPTKPLSKWMLFMLASTVALTGIAQSQSHFRTLYAFKGGADGATPTDPLVQDSSGNLYGTTFYGGNKTSPKSCVNLCGTVFELSPTLSGGWQKNGLYAFAGRSDGGNPQGPMAIDAAGNLYGTTRRLTDFKLSPTTSGPWIQSNIWGEVVYLGSGWFPDGLVWGPDGNLYGVAYSSGGDTIVYELSLSGGTWTFTPLHFFSYDEERTPYNSALLVDGDGNLFGTIAQLGEKGTCQLSQGCGAIYELSPGSGGTWSVKVRYLSKPEHGFEPAGPLVKDSDGNIFGTTLLGGADGDGIMFEISSQTDGQWKESILHSFNGTKGSSPTGLISDGNGGFYGTTLYGGNSNCTNGCGVLFHITQTPQGGWAQTVLHYFSGGYDGSLPNQIIRDASGNIYGTTQMGGNAVCECGTVFELTP
jgi:hypothetical protein